MPNAIDNNDLRVEFFRHDDRVAHRILVRGVPIAESIEGAPDDDWPPSPPFQEVHFEHGKLKHLTAPCDIALLVGMAGRSHWSASVTPWIGSEIRWEIACRLHGPTGWLGARYRLVAATATAGEDTVFRSTDIRNPVVTKHLRISLDAANAAEIAIQSDAEIEFVADQLALRVPKAPLEFPQTCVWSYSFSVASIAAR